LFIRARGIIDSQRRRIGGPDLRQLFDETFSAVSAGTVDTYANLHRDVEAFAAAEASRGRSLAQSLVEHQNVGLKSAVPQALRDEQFQLDNQRAIALQALGHLNVGDPKNRADYDRLDSALGLYAAQQRNLDERIRQTSPHYANLGDPEPMDLPAVQKVLDPGTLLIDYFVGKDHCYLFSATPEHFAMHRLDITRDELATEVNEFFDSVSDPRSSWNPNIAITLYRQLLVPLKDEIAKAKRLLICPNGVLWKVPFCALIDNGNASPERAHFLVETKPIHYVLSISVYAELKSELYRKRSAGPAFVGFGDPSYEMSNQSNSLGAVFARIPLTGIQVKAISRMYNVPPYVGSAASRYSVMKHAPGARRVHFAVHAVANEGRDPLSSYLALSPEKASDAAGVLAASDVIENLRLDADLVALVGCQTGAGRLTDGEGVIGLARAFQYAGARTVVCSLWETTAAATTRMFSGIDPATSELAPGRDAQKACFYGALNADRTIDEALREAQLFLIDRRGGEKASKFRNPYFWAPFSVQGYWR
jgi:CHAT domain-containing protein